MYRSKLRNDQSGPEGDEVARQKVEDYANRMRPAGFLV
jgi:maintenance of morphology protein 1